LGVILNLIKMIANPCPYQECVPTIFK